jgi:hypothetical protein
VVPKLRVAGFGGLPVIDAQEGGVLAPTVVQMGTGVSKAADVICSDI